MSNRNLTKTWSHDHDIEKTFTKMGIEWANSMGIHAERIDLGLECKNPKCRCKTRKKDKESLKSK